MNSVYDPSDVPFPEHGIKILIAGVAVVGEIGIEKWVNEYSFDRDFIVKFLRVDW
jgi:hypothetical protein